MDRRTADLTVAHIAAVRAMERRRLATVAFPIAAFGVVNLGGVPATAVLGRYHLALYGLPAFSLAILLSARALRRRADIEGVQLSIRPWALTLVALFFASASASRAGDVLEIDALSAAGPFLAQAIGLWLLARWVDSDALFRACALMVAASLVIATLTTGDLAVGLQFAVYGLVLLAAAHTVDRSVTSP